MKKKRSLSVLLMGFFGIIFAVSACMAFGTVYGAKKEQQAFQELAVLVEVVQEEAGQTDYGQAEAAEESGTVLREGGQPSPYAVLKDKNPDFFGWLSIEGTILDYPVMYTPNEPEYYLRRDFDKEKVQGGVPFLSGSSYEGCGNYLIYGHNMKNGTMFASLLSYADPEYRRQHPVIRFDTLTATGEYQVMAAFYSEAYAKDAEGVFRYYEYADVSDPAVFEEYVEQVQKAALYDTGVSAAYGDKLLTLSTCSYHTENGRFVVVARQEGAPES